MTTTSPEWVERPLAEVADYKVGRTPARASAAYWDQTGDVEPWVTISDMPAYGVVQKTKECISSEAFGRVFGGNAVPAGTLVMSFKLTIGRVATLGIPAVHNEAIISIFPKPGMDQRFLGYYLSQVDYTQLQDRQIKGNTLNKAKIDRIPVPVLPEPEQHAIADILDTIRDAIAVQRQAESIALELKRAVMNDVFTMGLRQAPLKQTEIGLIPDDWEPRTIAELCEIWSGGTPRKSVPEFWVGDVPWVSGKDLKSPVIDDSIDHLSEDGVDSGSRLAPEDSVFLLVRGMGLAKDLPVATISREMAFNQDVKALVLKDDYKKFRGRFLRSAIYAGKERLLSQIVTSAHGTMTLNLNDVESMTLAWPSDPGEAKEIVTLVAAIEDKVNLHRQKGSALEDLFIRLLYQFMAGDIRVDDLDLSALHKNQTQSGDVLT